MSGLAASSAGTSILAKRLGVATHVSALRYRFRRLMSAYPSGGAGLEDWLLDVANSRGARFVTRWPPVEPGFIPPDRRLLPDEDLVVALCLPNNLDRPALLRAAAQMISRGSVDPDALVLAARRERADRVLAELARQALRVDPSHSIWSRIQACLRTSRALRCVLLHWSRLAVPVPDRRGCNAEKWVLVA